MKDISDIKVLTENYDYVIEHNDEIVQRYKEIFTKIESK